MRMPQFNGTKLRLLRQARGWTHADLAALLRERGIKAATGMIGRWERKPGMLNATTIGVLAEIFEVDFEALVKRVR